MIYTIILINGREYDITEQERDSLLGKSGLIHITSLNITINMASVSVIEPKGLGKVKDRSKITEGRLHDGSRVVKRYGSWYSADNHEVSINPHYYPEIAGDFVVTDDEYETTIKAIERSDEKIQAMKAIANAGMDSGFSEKRPLIYTDESKKLQSFKEIAKISPVDYYEGQ